MHKILLGFFFFLNMLWQSSSAQICDLDFEDWESATNANPPTGWQRIDSYVGSQSGNSYNGAKYGGMNTLGDKWVVEPLNCPGEICFYWRASGASSDWDVDIDWSVNNGNNWTTAHTISLDGNGSPTTYTQLCVDLPENLFNAPFENILIRFHHARRNSGSFYFDDVCVSGGTCTVTPTQLTFKDLQAGCLQKNTPFTVTVCATDANGYEDNTFNGSIDLSATNLLGTTNMNAINGCAQFNNLQFNLAGIYAVTATSTFFSGISPDLTIEEICPNTESIKVMVYNLLNFPDGRNDCSPNIQLTARWDTLRKIVQYTQPDVLMVCELQTEAGADKILTNALNVFGQNNYARVNFVANQSPGGTVLNNAFFYNTNKMTLYSQSEIQTNVRDIGEYIVYMNDPNLAAHQDTTFIDFYTAHLKAGTGVDNVASRESQCQTMQDYVTAKGENRNAVIGGDFNFYTSTEAGYQVLLGGTYPFLDPLNSPGDWDNDVSFSDIHTQATRPFGSDFIECGATGGMDSRFDFLLISDNVNTGSDAVEYVNGSYDELGNDGNLFNVGIDNPANMSGVPDSVLNALYYMSDHLPVILDLEVTYPLAVLPLELLSFEAHLVNKQARLSWEIIEQNDLDYFILEKSFDGRFFSELTKIQKQNSSTYQFVDTHSTNNIQYYRLKLVEKTGDFSFSPIRSITQPIAKWSTFPNPATDKLTLQFEEDFPSYENMELTIYNTLGAIVFYEKIIAKNQIELNLENWLSGFYVIELKTNYDFFTQRFLKR